MKSYVGAEQQHGICQGSDLIFYLKSTVGLSSISTIKPRFSDESGILK